MFQGIYCFLSKVRSHLWLENEPMWPCLRKHRILYVGFQVTLFEVCLMTHVLPFFRPRSVTTSSKSSSQNPTKFPKGVLLKGSIQSLNSTLDVSLKQCPSLNRLITTPTNGSGLEYPRVERNHELVLFQYSILVCLLI